MLRTLESSQFSIRKLVVPVDKLVIPVEKFSLLETFGYEPNLPQSPHRQGEGTVHSSLCSPCSLWQPLPQKTVIFRTFARLSRSCMNPGRKKARMTLVPRICRRIAAAYPCSPLLARTRQTCGKSETPYASWLVDSAFWAWDGALMSAQGPKPQAQSLSEDTGDQR